MCPAGPAPAEFRVETRLCAQVPTGRRRGMELQSPGDGVWGIPSRPVVSHEVWGLRVAYPDQWCHSGPQTFL